MDPSPKMNKTPVPGRQNAPPISAAKKSGVKQNQSILSFFGKSERAESSPLFFDDGKRARERSPEQTLEGAGIFLSQEESRFNEDETPVKRRRIEGDDFELPFGTPSSDKKAVESCELQVQEVMVVEEGPKKSTPRRRGGFVADSDSDDDGDLLHGSTSSVPHESATVTEGCEQHLSPVDFEPGHQVQTSTTTERVPLKSSDDTAVSDQMQMLHNGASRSENTIPSLNREGTSMYAPGEFGEDDDFRDEFLEEGEEYMERMFMQEQQEMEAGLDDDSKSESGTDSVRTPESVYEEDIQDPATRGEEVQTCPICSGTMKGLSGAQASSHVNACLDGTAQPLPSVTEDIAVPIREKKTSTADVVPLRSSSPGSRRFQRAAVARPGQTNPFSLMKDGKSGGSAFSKLMSGHAEDAAWVEAASNEKESRGKQAYQRTCPFYKIMAGLYICVDAFRYGKVEGQNAYFLSHFHSDHYIGLTSSWRHGPIYASKITCNLMRQQLRVDPKWLVPLEFEKKVEVPNTKGVFVTMIPANHCPGSSLYLFEKIIGRNKDGSPRLTRVLHCGDFRACPAHIQHPLLRPDVVDSITGQTKQQVIDTCYLDTTYLTPKYAFPSQYDVINACAQMCVSLAKEIVDSGDNWEQTKNQLMGSTMTKFLEKGESTLCKPEPSEVDTKPRIRGRLLVVIGTYSIGKERICLGIAKALGSKIYAPPAKMRICSCLEDAELNSLLTSDPLEAQIHMQTLMEIRADTLHDYLLTFKPHFSRIVGFRPTGWSYRPPTSRFTENPAVNTVLYSEGWKSRFTMKDLTPQRGSTREANCIGVPYSEHSSFRELTMFCCALRINRVVPTVNVGSAKTREKMKAWIDKWEVEKRKNGLFKVEAGEEGWGSGDGGLRYGV